MVVLVVATTNEGKRREYANLLSGVGLELRSLRDYPPQAPIEEDGATFRDNAIKKASIWASALGAPVLADDSGLEVDALGGAPGLHSARYAGPEQDAAANLAKLLGELGKVPEGRRQARFVCVIAVARPDGRLLTVEGDCEGRIAPAARGDGGFGYDPVFVPNGCELTFAEMAEEEKDRLSHRGRAAEQLRPQLPRFLAGDPETEMPRRGGV